MRSLIIDPHLALSTRLSLTLFCCSVCSVPFSRLAVSFKSDDESPSDSALVAVFNTHMRYSSAHPDLTFGGFVRGPSSTKPAIIAFEAGCSATVSSGPVVCAQMLQGANDMYYVC